MTMFHRFVAAACSSRFITDKGRRILVVGMTHIVVAEAIHVNVDFRELNAQTGIARRSHAFWLCDYISSLVKRRICLDSVQVREIPTERLTRWFVHYTPKWLRYQGTQYNLQDDIRDAIDCTLSRQ
jgi:hypothetical protein